jgi:hypothetical protein
MRLQKAGIVMATVAALAVGAGTAHAGTGPAPRSSSAKHTVTRSATPSAAGNPASVRAQAAGICSDAYQIGATTYMGGDAAGNPLVSLKQFYSPKCQRNYGYMWVWQSFRTADPDPYVVQIGVYDQNLNKVLGQVTVQNTRQQEFWSQGTATVKDCTRADGNFESTYMSVYTQTARRC